MSSQGARDWNGWTSADAERPQLAVVNAPEGGATATPLPWGELEVISPTGTDTAAGRVRLDSITGPPPLEGPQNSSRPWFDLPQLRGMEMVVQRVKRLARGMVGGLSMRFVEAQAFEFAEDGEEELTQVSMEIILDECDAEAVAAYRRALYEELTAILSPRDLVRLALLVRRA